MNHIGKMYGLTTKTLDTHILRYVNFRFPREIRKIRYLPNQCTNLITAYMHVEIIYPSRLICNHPSRSRYGSITRIIYLFRLSFITRISSQSSKAIHCRVLELKFVNSHAIYASTSACPCWLEKARCTSIVLVARLLVLNCLCNVLDPNAREDSGKNFFRMPILYYPQRYWTKSNCTD